MLLRLRDGFLRDVLIINQQINHLLSTNTTLSNLNEQERRYTMNKEHVDLFILQDSLEGGGAQRIGLELASSLPDSIKRMLIVIKGTSTPKYIEEENITIKYLSPPRKYRNYAFITFPAVIIRYIHQLLHNRPRVVLSIVPLDNIINITFSRLFKYKALISAHGMRSYAITSYSIITRILVNLEQFLLKHTSAELIAVSYAVKKDIEDRFNIPCEKIHVIHNPLNIERIVPLSLEPVTDIQFNVPTIITVGRLHAVKSQWHLIRAFAEFRKNNPSQLLICGEGEEMSYLLDLVKNLEIEDSVMFLGWKDNPYKYMSKSSVFVQSSLSEALPNVLVEAMACGCPVVAAGCSDGISEILGSDGSCGIVTKKMSEVRHLPTEPLDEGEISLLEGMEEVLLNSERRNAMAIQCIERAKMFDVDVGIQKYVQIINAVDKYRH